MGKWTEEAKALILAGGVVENGRMPFDTIRLTKTNDNFVFTYSYKGKPMFSQECSADLNAGWSITLSDHIGSIGLSIEP